MCLYLVESANSMRTGCHGGKNINYPETDRSVVIVVTRLSYISHSCKNIEQRSECGWIAQQSWKGHLACTQIPNLRCELGNPKSGLKHSRIPVVFLKEEGCHVERNMSVLSTLSETFVLIFAKCSIWAEIYFSCLRIIFWGDESVTNIAFCLHHHG